MGYERYRGDARQDRQDYGRDYGTGRGDAYRPRDEAGGRQADDRGDRQQGREGYGARDYGNDRYRQREEHDRGQYQGMDRDAGWRGGRYPQPDEDRGARDGYGRQPQGYQSEDRGFISRAGDEVRSWFGDEDAERRREADARYDERLQGAHDDHYHSWRRGQIEALDRDYEEYRHENRTKFENEFSAWRTERQGQRSALSKVAEHMEVLGSDGAHVGTVDKVRGDRILLTRTDKDAGGHHHSIPSRWIGSVKDKVTLSRTAADAKRQWQEEENARAMFGDRTRDGGDRDAPGTGPASDRGDRRGY